jgi:hypothetical protein
MVRPALERLGRTQRLVAQVADLDQRVLDEAF